MHSIKPSFDVVVRWLAGWWPDVTGCFIVFVFGPGLILLKLMSLILLKLMSARFMLTDFKLLSEVVGEASFPAR